MFLSGKYITEVYIIKYEQYVNRFIIIMKYVLCTQITFTFLLSQTLWMQKPHNHGQLMAPRSLINSLSSLRSSFEFSFGNIRRKWLTVIYSFFFWSGGGWSQYVFERSYLFDCFDKSLLKWQNGNKYFMESSFKSDLRWLIGIYRAECRRRWYKCFGTDLSQNPAAILKFAARTLQNPLRHWHSFHENWEEGEEIND